MSEAFGIMDSAYFVNKNDILKWINTTLKLQIEKIDQLGTGAVYCQLLDMIYPGSVCMSKVNWKAKLEYEYLSNFKIVTTCLEKNDVKKHVDVNKLVKCRYQDNLEFAQWFKKFFDLKGGDRSTEYDAEARRAVKGVTNLGNEVPKAARKEAQKNAVIAATIPAEGAASTQASGKSSVTTNAPAVKVAATTVPASTTATTSSKVVHSSIPSHSVAKKPAVVPTPAANKSTAPTTTAKTAINTKRTFSQMQAGSTKSKVPPAQPVQAVTKNSDYNLLVSALSEILTSGQNDASIISKIKQLVKDNGNTNTTQAVNNASNAQQGKENEGGIVVETAEEKSNTTATTQAPGEEASALKDSTNTAIEQETA